MACWPPASPLWPDSAPTPFLLTDAWQPRLPSAPACGGRGLRAARRLRQCRLAREFTAPSEHGLAASAESRFQKQPAAGKLFPGDVPLEPALCPQKPCSQKLYSLTAQTGDAPNGPRERRDESVVATPGHLDREAVSQHPTGTNFTGVLWPCPEDARPRTGAGRAGLPRRCPRGRLTLGGQG